MNQISSFIVVPVFVDLMITNKARTLGVFSVTVIAALIVAFPLGAADAVGEAVDKARILTFGEDESIITLKVNPTEDLDDLSFKGYAILTTDPDTEDVGTLIAITRHGGVYDSQTQTSSSDNNWHAHYVDLIQQDKCVNTETNPDGLAVDPFRISFTEPGKVIVKEGKNGLVLKKAQAVDYIDINYFAFLKDPQPALPTDNIQKYTLGDVGDGQAVSFDLSLGDHGFADDDAGIPNGVCVDNVQPVNTKLVDKSSEEEDDS